MPQNWLLGKDSEGVKVKLELLASNLYISVC